MRTTLPAQLLIGAVLLPLGCGQAVLQVDEVKADSGSEIKPAPDEFRGNRPFCGDGVCKNSEDCGSCPWDCGFCVDPCGDGVCADHESCASCAEDCGTCVDPCGDGVCAADESCAGCAEDCGTCQEACPAEWRSEDVGTLALPGSLECLEGTFELRGSGADIWGGADAFHFAYQTLVGDGVLIARVAALEATNRWAKAGLMFREALTPGSRHVHLLVSAGAENPVKLDLRSVSGGGTLGLAGALGAAPRWLRLERAGSLFRGFESADGASWQLVGQHTLELPSELYVGLTTTAHDEALLCTARFDHVSVEAGRPPGCLDASECDDGDPATRDSCAADGTCVHGPAGPLPVFPGAEGFGVATPAGRGGRIIRVTTLADSGPGSLREAVQAQGPRVVVFEVAGVIRLASELAITQPFITIAGQTAPAPGITLRDRALRIGTHDVLVQHLRSRPGDVPGIESEYEERDALTIQDYQNDIYDVVVDHCSFSWAVDEVIGIWGYASRRLSDITISNSIVAEGLHYSLKTEPHSKGLLVGDYARNVAILGNLIASNHDRNGPLFKGGTSGIVLNNLVYNAGLSYRLGFADDYGAGPSTVSAVGNLWHDGPAYATRGPVYLNPNVKQGTQIYLSDNLTVRVDDSLANVPLVQVNVTWGDPIVGSAPIWTDGLTVRPVAQVEARVLAQVGARPAERGTAMGDAADERVVEDVSLHGGFIIDSPSQVGGYPVIPATSRPFVEPADPHGDADGDGYTNLEEVLHAMATALER